MTVHIFLKGYIGPCANLHGHRWVVQAVQAKASLIESGEQRAMVADFGDVKKGAQGIEADKQLDHQLILEIGSVSEGFIGGFDKQKDLVSWKSHSDRRQKPCLNGSLTS